MSKFRVKLFEPVPTAYGRLGFAYACERALADAFEDDGVLYDTEDV